MARTWLQIRVDLLGSGGADLKDPPGRILIVGPAHSFEALAEAINQAFARWDLSHLHEFELADGRRIGYPSDDFAPDLTWEDQAELKVLSEVGPGEEFRSGAQRQGRSARGVRAWAVAEAAGGDLGLERDPDQYGRESAVGLELEP